VARNSRERIGQLQCAPADRGAVDALAVPEGKAPRRSDGIRIGRRLKCYADQMVDHVKRE